MTTLTYQGQEIPVRERAVARGVEYTFLLPRPDAEGEHARIVALIDLTMRTDRAIAIVHAIDVPDCRRHRYKEGSLCMWFEKDPAEQRWVVGDGLDALARHVARHLAQEACCRAGEPWPGDESPEREHPRFTSCKTCGGHGL